MPANDYKREDPPAKQAAPIFLVGFMGAGKTTVGKALAQRLGWEFWDLDEKIKAGAGKSVATIFAELGESAFRAYETEAIKACRGQIESVIALGGGAYVSAGNRSIIRAIGSAIWLDCPLDTCLARIGRETGRPLLGSEAEMSALLEKRRSAYGEADHIVDAGVGEPDEIAARIIEALRF